MKKTRLRILGAFVLAGTCLSIGVTPSRAQLKAASGKLAGVVNDTLGVPQMGATVQLISESAGTLAAVDFLTNTQGVFRGERVTPGLYTVRATLAGFLPTLEQHVRINPHVTTVVRLELESMFASLDQLRRTPSSSTVESDDWKWVLRSASATRPVLQWVESDDDGSQTVANGNLDKQVLRPRARLEFTDGARRPGSASGVPSAPATAFAYDQKLGRSGRLLMAGEMNYLDSAPGGGIATIWLPTGSLASGTHSTVVIRDAKLGPDGQVFRGVRMEQGGTLSLGGRAKLLYGGEYVLVGLDKAASSLRPRLELDAKLTDSWHASLIFAEEPGGVGAFDPDDPEAGAALAAAVGDLDSFPTLLWRNGSPVLEGGWHEEIAAEHKIGARGQVQVAAFHDDNTNVAVYGRGGELPSSDYLQDYFSNAFAYDGGSVNSWGTRVALREKLSDDVEITTVYAYAGALSPSDLAEGILRDMLKTSMHHSVGASVTTTVPRSKTKVVAGYTWVSGTTVSRLDGYGESVYQTDPYLHVGLRQALPKFGPGRWQAIADCDNILAQGYVTLNTREGRSTLVPAFRTFRGGLSVQF